MFPTEIMIGETGTTVMIKMITKEKEVTTVMKEIIVMIHTQTEMKEATTGKLTTLKIISGLTEAEDHFGMENTGVIQNIL